MKIPTEASFTAPAHDRRVSARLGLALGIAFGLCFLTGLLSHWIQHPPGPDVHSPDFRYEHFFDTNGGGEHIAGRVGPAAQQHQQPGTPPPPDPESPIHRALG